MKRVDGSPELLSPEDSDDGQLVATDRRATSAASRSRDLIARWATRFMHNPRLEGVEMGFGVGDSVPWSLRHSDSTPVIIRLEDENAGAD